MKHGTNKHLHESTPTEIEIINIANKLRENKEACSNEMPSRIVHSILEDVHNEEILANLPVNKQQN